MQIELILITPKMNIYRDDDGFFFMVDSENWICAQRLRIVKGKCVYRNQKFKFDAKIIWPKFVKFWKIGFAWRRATRKRKENFAFGKFFFVKSEIKIYWQTSAVILNLESR